MTENLIDQLSSFVQTVCKDRDESHGWHHMKKVYENSKQIMDKMDKVKRYTDNNIREMVYICAWLHDVNDHKYDHDNTLTNTIYEFLSSTLLYDDTKIALILNIISRVSFSKEVKTGSDDWLSVLGEIGVLVRDIVSDADKLEAIGKSGIERCIAFTKERYMENYEVEIPYEAMVANVKKHANEKLLILKNRYIRTSVAKKMAEPLHNEMVNMLNNL